MIEVTGNLWTHAADFRVITTNGTTRHDGHAVMGRGCAKEAAEKYPRLSALLGQRLHRRGNRVHFFAADDLGADRGLFTFPVKYHWQERAALELIAISVDQFRTQVLSSATYVMPRPGCGNGGLEWQIVKPVLLALPDNVHVIDFGK